MTGRRTDSWGEVLQTIYGAVLRRGGHVVEGMDETIEERDVQKPPGFTFLFAANDPGALGSVETSPLLRFLRPATFALWFIVFALELIGVVTTGEMGSWLVLVLSTALLAGVHVQFWYEESEQGRKVHHALERMRGRMYEDDATGLPNSRHFVFELRRQMMRSVRSGRGFSLVLTDLGGFERDAKVEQRVLGGIGRALRHAASETDFVAHLEGPVFAAILVDDRERSTRDKAEALQLALMGAVTGPMQGRVRPVISLTGYEGELEVRDYLGRAQRDLAGIRGALPAPTEGRREGSTTAA